MIGPLPDLPGMHLDRGYDSAKTRDLLESLGYQPHIATKGLPAPIQAGKRRPVGRTHSWLNGYGTLAPHHRHTHDHPCPNPLPLAHPTHHPTTPLTLNCRTL